MEYLQVFLGFLLQSADVEFNFGAWHNDIRLTSVGSSLVKVGGKSVRRRDETRLAASSHGQIIIGTGDFINVRIVQAPREKSQPEGVRKQRGYPPSQSI